ncbi:MAG: hypothetical protein ABW321_31050, partial [Polyangiales bacterium]
LHVTLPASLVRRVLHGLVLVACFCAVIGTRVLLSARAELAEAEALLARHDEDAAVVHLRRAARWYAPLSPYHVRALAQLTTLAQAAEQRGDTARALAAYRAVRGSILATRSLYVPERPQLQAANEHIARLLSREPAPGIDAGKTVEQLRREHLALLTPIPGPNVFWSCVLLAGFACWVGSAFAFSVRAIDAEDHWVRSEVQRWGSLIALGFGLFVLGMVLV